MIGRNPGLTTTQGEKLTDMFGEAGYPVTSVSSSKNRYWRLADIISTLIQSRNRVDILMLQVYGGPSFVVEDIASWLGRRFGQRIVMTLRGGAMPEFMARYPKWARRVLARADVLVAPSEFLARAVLPYGFEARVIPNVIDLSAYPYRQRSTLRPGLFWMRSFHPIWNPEMAIRTLARLRTTVPDATLAMAGQDKGTRAEVERLAQELKLGDAVRFTGFLDREGKAREADAADIYINTNRVDNMPVAVVEAMACGLPVVATEVSGIPDLLTHEKTGLFVPSEDEEAMVRAIQRLLNDPELTARLSVNGRRLAERSSWEQVRPQWEELFAGLMGHSPAKKKITIADRQLGGAIVNADSGNVETL
jgi:glycosyltransferase involved in cell wall biosynthesis